MSVIDVGECARNEWRRAKQYGARAKQYGTTDRNVDDDPFKSSAHPLSVPMTHGGRSERMSAVASQVMTIETK